MKGTCAGLQRGGHLERNDVLLQESAWFALCSSFCGLPFHLAVQDARCHVISSHQFSIFKEISENC